MNSFVLSSVAFWAKCSRGRCGNVGTGHSGELATLLMPVSCIMNDSPNNMGEKTCIYIFSWYIQNCIIVLLYQEEEEEEDTKQERHRLCSLVQTGFVAQWKRVKLDVLCHDVGDVVSVECVGWMGRIYVGCVGRTCGVYEKDVCVGCILECYGSVKVRHAWCGWCEMRGVLCNVWEGSVGCIGRVCRVNWVKT